MARALDGSGPALVPVTGGAGLPPGLADHVPADVALVVPTSGSTGLPRHALLDGSALLASAAATHRRLGGPGRWLLALPLDHVAGLQVLVRSAVAGTVPVPADPRDVRSIAAAAAGLVPDAAGAPLYASIVPTQLHRLLAEADADPGGAALAALARFDALLVGGAAAGPALVDRAARRGLRVVTTYGMTETCGGCVYDGVPLDGVAVAVRDGVVELAGPVLARGYAQGGDDAFVTRADGRWFVTADLGTWDGHRLTVHGRRDDVLVVGGQNVAPAAVEHALAGLVGEVCVVGLPDDRWGQVPVAVVVPGPAGPPTLAEVRDVISRTLGSAAAPRRLVVVDALPLRGPGKVDRAAAARLAAQV